MNKIIYTSRSNIVQRQECSRMGFLSQHWGGTGLQRESGALPLLNGIAIHGAHASLFVGDPVDRVIADTLEGYKTELLKGREWTAELQVLYNEQATMLEGMIRTWAWFRLPQILEEYEVADYLLQPFIEREFTYTLAPGVVAQMRLDAVLRRRSDNALVIWDFKTLAYPSDDWYRQFEHSPQTYLYTAALAELMAEPVEGIAYEGLVKGLRKRETAQKSPFFGTVIQHSPYTYAYKLDVDGINLYQTSYTAKKGYHKVAAHSEMPAKDWFETVLVPEHKTTGLFNDLFCLVPPINPAQWEVDRWTRQTIYSEYLTQKYLEEIEEANANHDPGLAQQLMEIYFPTNEGRCFKYGVGNECQFTPLCFNESVEGDPLDSGYIRRIPHHDAV